MSDDARAFEESTYRKVGWQLIPLLLVSVCDLGRQYRAGHGSADAGNLRHSVYSAMFWSLPTAFLAGTGAAAGIAMINSQGNLSGFISPCAVGWLKELTASTNAGMYLLSAVLVAGALLTLKVPAHIVNK